MAIDDNTTYGLKGSQIKDVAKGLIKTLTTADYNYPADNSDGVALWKFETGVYQIPQGVNCYINTGKTLHASAKPALVLITNTGANTGMIFPQDGGTSNSRVATYVTNTASGTSADTAGAAGNAVLKYSDITNSLTFGYANQVLSGAQGKILNDKIGGDLSNLATTDKTSLINAINELVSDIDDVEPLSGLGAPTTSTEGTLGQDYVDTSTGNKYYLSEIDETTTPTTYTWTQYASGSGGGIITLTTADYNWSQSGQEPYTAVNATNLPVGIYKAGESIVWHTSGATLNLSQNEILIIAGFSNSNREYIYTLSGYVQWKKDSDDGSGRNILRSAEIVQNLSSTNDYVPLSAKQGKVLNERIGDLTTLTTTAKTSAVAAINELAGKTATSGNSAPTTATEGEIGQLYVDTSTGDIYYLESIDNSDPSNPVYTWTELGGGVNVVQTTGTSTTDVMSQKATSNMVYPSGYETSKTRINIGSVQSGSHADSVFIGALMPSGQQSDSVAIAGNLNGASRSVAIGANAFTNAPSAIALGYGARAESKGQMDISATIGGSVGYNNSTYRLLTGLYDPQSAHDAATKGYVDNAVGSTISDEDYNDLWS